MLCLGIESTAHTFGIGIVDERGRVLANAKDVYAASSGGIVPADAKRHHEEVKELVLQRALDDAKAEISDIGLVSFSAGPGLPPCLLVGLNYANELAAKAGAPLLGVNHCIAHIEIGKLDTGAKDPLVVYVSGGNTQIIGYDGGRYRIFGETLDIGIGNALDKFARELGMATPAGARLDAMAAEGKKYVELPYTVKGMDLSFSGLVTAASRKIGAADEKGLVHSFLETSYSMLVEVAERALAHTKKKEVLLTGGVAASGRLRNMLTTMAKEHGAKFFVPSREFCGDNGAMIAWTGLIAFKAGQKGPADIDPRWRTDEAEIGWL
jgi:universal protein Kae1